jgi:hypothetical protein
MYAWRTFPDVSLTRATLRFAEFGFLGFALKTCITMPFRWGLLSRRGALGNAFFCGRLQRIAWLSVRSVGAEEWNGLVANAVDVVHVWNTGNAGREMGKGVRDTDGRAKAVRKENITLRG